MSALKLINDDGVCVPAVTHPGGHASGGKPGDVVLKVDSSNPDHVHLVCWVVQGAERKKLTLFHLKDLEDVYNSMSELRHGRA